MHGWARLSAVAVTAAFAMSGCGSTQVAQDAPPAPEVVAAQTPVDPFAWTDVRYQDYRAAALQVPISTELLVQPAELTQSLDQLCHTDPAGFAQLLADQETRARNEAENDLDKHLAKEVELRLGMACPQRMGDWMTAQRDAEPAQSTTTDQPDITASEPSDPNADSRVESPQEVEGEQLPENPYVDEGPDEVPASVAGSGGG